MAVNVQLSLTPCSHETRLMKQVYSIKQANLFKKILIFGLKEDGLEENQILAGCGQLWRVPLISKKLKSTPFYQMIKYTEWMLRILFRLRKESVWVVQCHSIATLPVGILVKVIWNARLIYDAHELETETNGLCGKRKKMLKLLENICMHFVDMLVVVSESIAQWYAQHYRGVKPIVVRNIPDCSNRESGLGKCKGKLRNQLGLSNDAILFLYQGGMVRGRSIEKLIDVFERVDENRHILFLGSGEYAMEIAQKAQNKHNIHYIPAVEPEILLEYTKQADIGFCLIENICLSYYYSLPNKFFEYILAGVPVITNNSPEQKEIVLKYGGGWVIEDEVISIVDFVKSVNRVEIERKKVQLGNPWELFSWKDEIIPFIESCESIVKKTKEKV